jgi:hypothetical protein
VRGKEDKKPHIFVTFKGEQKSFSPEEISSMVLPGFCLSSKKTHLFHLPDTLHAVCPIGPIPYTHTRHPTPYTLCPMPYTLCPMPYALY